MAVMLTMRAALIQSGAIAWLTQSLFSQIDVTYQLAPILFTRVMIILLLLAHLLIQSRSARSVVVIPIAVSLAPKFNVSPVAIAFISTAAAGFCHSLTSSAKPIAILHQTETQNTFNPEDLLKLSFYLTPIMLVLLFILHSVFSLSWECQHGYCLNNLIFMYAHCLKNILILPSGFKESCSGTQVGEAIKLANSLPHALIQAISILDGGEILYIF